MPDLDQLFDTLRESTAAGSARDARTRGDKLRRRRTAAAAVASCLAVAVVVGGVAWSQTGLSRTAPDPAAPTPTVSDTPDANESPAPAPTTASVTSIPDDFPLALGYPAVDGDGERLGPGQGVKVFDGETVCEGPVDFHFDPQDRLAVRQEAPERPRQRLLMTFETPRAAQEAMSRVTNEYSFCPRQDYGDGTASLNRVSPDVLGDESYLIVRRQEMFGELAPGVRVLLAIRVANVVLLSGADSEAIGDPATVRSKVEEGTGEVTALVEEMCVFSREGC